MEISTLNQPKSSNIKSLIGNNLQTARIFFVSIAFFFCALASFGQGAALIPLTYPPTGSEIDGDLRAGTTTGGDWFKKFSGTSPEYIFNDDGTPKFTGKLLFVQDGTGSADNVFNTVNLDGDPNLWTWKTGKAQDKSNINNAMFFLGSAPPIGTETENQQWLFAAIDRESGNGFSYVQMEFLQNTLTTSGGPSSGGFVSSAPALGDPLYAGGRTENDFMLRIVFPGNATDAIVTFFLWKKVGSVWQYTAPSGGSPIYYSKANAGLISDLPSKIGSTSYNSWEFLEIAINATDLFKRFNDPCLGIKVKTLMIETKASEFASGAVDFVQPVMQTDINLGTSISYNDPFCPTGDFKDVTQTGTQGGKYTSNSINLPVDLNTGRITLPNSNAGAGTHTITYTFRPVGCGIDKIATTNVVVNPFPAVNTPNTAVICSGTSPNISLTASVPSSFSWTVGSGSTGGITGASSGSGSTINQTLTNPSSTTVGTVEYIVTPTSIVNGLPGCTGSPYTITVSVSPKPVGSASPQTICSNTTSSVPLSSSVAGTTYTWTAAIQTAPTGGTITGQSNGSGSTIAQTLINTGTTAGVIRYTVTPFFGSCSGLPFTVDVTVNPNSTIVLTSGAQSPTVCAGIAIPTAVYTYGGSANNASVSGLPSGLTSSVNTLAKTVTISGTPTVGGTYTITTSGNIAPCAPATISGIVTYNALPTVSFTTGVIYPCEGSTDNSYATQLGMTNYVWTVSAGGTITAGGGSSHNFVTVSWNTPGAQSVSVNYTNANGCTAPSSKSTAVTVNPISTIVLTSGTQSPTVCSGTTITNTVYTYGGSATNAVVSGLPTGLSSTVDTGLKTVTISGTPIASGTYTITTSGHTGLCTGATISGTVKVNTPSTIVLTSGNQNPTVCAGTAITSTVYTFGGSAINAIVTSLPTGLSSIVDIGLKTVTISGTPTASGTYLITTTGQIAPCTSGTINGTVTVNPLPTVFNITGGGTFCSGGTGLPLGLSGSQVGVNYQLQIGGSPTGSIIAGTGNSISFGNYSTTGAYTAKATYSGTGCTANMAGSVSIASFPSFTASFTAGVATACAGSSGNVYSTQSGMTNYFWNVSTGGTITLGGGINDNSVTVTWNTAGAQNVSVVYVNLDGCTSASAANYAVTVNALPTIYNVTGGGSYCTGGTGVAVGLSNSQTGVNYQLKLNGGDNGSPIPGTGAALNFGNKTGAGVYTVVATNTSTLCSSTMSGSATVTVNPLPTVSFTAGEASPCIGSTGNLYSTQAGMSNYIWSVSSGGTITAGGGTGNNSVTVTWNTTGAKTVSVNYTNSNGCTATSATSYAVNVNPLPTAYLVTGGGTYCSAGTGVPVGLSSSQSLVTYQLQIGGANIGSPVAGTGAALSFGNQTLAGTYTVVASNTATSCSVNMTGSVNIAINPLPTAFNVTGGGTDCSGGSGIPIGLSNSQSGINYQLQLGGVDSGSPIAGNGSPLSFGSKTVAGTYTVVATNALTTCSVTMTGNVIIILTPLPTVYNVTGGGSYCAGGSGVSVGLSNSQNGVNYQLIVNGVNTGSAVSGTTGAISFGLQTTAGTYSVSATIVSTGCTSLMNGSVAVSINPLSTVYNVTGGGSYCIGGSGLVVGLSDSDSGVNYQLKLDGTNVGAVVAGNGSALSFGIKTSAGVYTVEATNTTTGCKTTMNGSVTITINSLPTAYTVTGGGSYCSGGAGVTVGLSSSQSGVNYQLWRGAANTGVLITGTGSPISFGAQTTAGNYTVVAVNPATSCSSTMTGSATVTINALPTAFVVTGGGFYCSGGSGVLIGLSGSEVGVNYQLRIGLVDSGSPVVGIGSAISFGVKSTAGIYSVVATRTATSCTSTMSGTVTVGINPLPQAYTITGGGTDCSGGSGVEVGLSDSQIGVNYQLKVGISNVGSPVPGTDSPLNFGTQILAGTYTVVATDASTSCSSTMTGSVTITLTALPISYNVTGGGSYCTSGAGVVVGLSNSEVGVNYQLRINGIDTGSPVTGTSAALSFGSQTAAGTYSVMATIVSTGCKSLMNGSVVVSINPLPTIFAVTGGGSYCSGGSGVSINLSGSQNGVNYQLQIGGSNTGSLVAGTGSSISFSNITVAGVYNVVATNSSSSCTSTMSGNATVVVNPLPVVTISGSTSVCETSTGNIYTTQSGMSSYVWTVSAGGTITSGGGSTNNSVTVSWNTPGNQSVSVNYSNGNGCAASASTIYGVTVNALPTVYNVSGSGSFCSGGSGVAVILSNSQSGVNYQLQLDGVNSGLPTSGTGSSINFGNKTTAGVYTVVATHASTLCTSNMAGNATITVNPLPVVSFTGGASPVCEGSSGNVYTTQSGMSNYVWNVSTGGTISAGGGSASNSVTVIWNTPGAQSVSVNYTNVNGCTATSATNYPVTVNALPVMTISTAATCAPNLLTYSVSVSVSSGTVTSTSGTVTNIGNLWTVSNVTTGTSIVLTLTDALSCSTTLSVTAPNCSCPVILSPVSGGDQEYCAGSSIPALTASVQSGETVDWYGTSSVGVALAIGTTSYTPSSAGIYYAEARNSISNCKSSTRTAIVLSSNPVTGTTSFTAGATTICQNAADETYTATAANSTSIAYSVLPIGAGTINSSTGLMNWSLSFSGVATVRATSTGLCGTTFADRVVTVNASTGTTSFTAGSTIVCQDAANETYTATAANSTSITYSVLPAGAGSINSSTGLMDWSPSFSGTATITATASGLCGTTFANRAVTVNPSTGTTSFTAGSTTVCQDAANETYTATAANSTSITYSVLPVAAGTINSSTGLMNWSPSFSGLATITATASGLCGTTLANRAVTVNPSTGTTSFTAGSATVCQDATDETYTATAANSTSITYSVLPAGAGTINSLTGLMNWSPSFSGTATVTATATGLCGTTHADRVVNVNPSTGITSFTAGTTTICQDAADETYTATAANSTSITYSVLPVAAGTINSSTGLMNWSSTFSGTATITATANGLCGTTLVNRAVTVNPSTGTTSFTTGSATICQDASDETYTATAANSTSVIYSVLPVGAGTINSSTGLMNWSPSFSGTATVTATATGLCGTTHADLVVTVNPSTGTTSFTAGSTTICQDATDETYTATAANSTSIAYSVLPVAAGTINLSTGLMNWSPSFSGTATITATSSGLCGTTLANRAVNVNPSTGTTSFTAGSTTICQDAADETYTAIAANSTSLTYSVLPAGAGTINSSTGLMNWSPSFSGTAVVTAIATGLCGTTQAARTILVNPSTGETTFIAGANALCQDAPNEIYTATSTNSTSILYSISPTSAGTINSSTGEVDWASSFSGTATIQATSFGICGTTNALRSVTIHPLPVVIAGSDRTICTGSNTKLGGTAVLGNTYSWTSVPAGFTSTLADPLVNPSVTTVYTLVETNSFTGCSNSGTVTVTVNPLPIVSAPASVCAGSTVVLSPTSGGTWISSNTSVATVTDAGVVSGVSAGSVSFTFTKSITGCSATTTTVVVNQEPIFTFCPSDISVNTSINQCNAVVNYSAIALGSPMPTISFTFSGATTNSGAGTGSGSSFNQGITTVHITATNSCGTKTCSFSVTVKDNELPVISCPVAISKSNDPALCGAVVAISNPVATDNCSTSFVFNGVRSDALPLTSVFPVGNTTIRWTATDGAGNVSESCEQLVIVTDAQKPTITAPVAKSVNSDAGICSASGVILGTPVTADNCSVASVTNNAVEPFAIGNTTVIWKVTDASGNFETATQIVTVTDNQKPTITAPAAVSVISNAGLCTASGVILGTPVTADNCSVASVTNNAVEPFAIGNTTVIWTVTDASGNFATATQIVTVIDDQKPTITAPVAVSVYSDAGLCTASGVILGIPVTADNCSVASITNDAVEPFALGNTTITWTVTDASGNFETATQTVTVTDNQKPTLTAPETVSVNSDTGLCTASGVNLGIPLTADNCSLASVSNDAVEPFALGNTIITWTVTDASGNFETATQLVTVTDIQKPTITAPVALSVISDAGLCTASGVILGSPVASDNCSAVSIANDAVQPFAIGSTTVTWTVTDGSGNVETATQLVTVLDDQDPTITAPAAVSVNSDTDLCTASGVILGTPVTADNCSVASITNDAVQPFAIGNTTVIWTVTDASGNFATASQIVTVKDNQKPTITAPVAVSVNSDIDLCSASGIILGTPVTADNCSVASITNDAVEPFALGITTITWTVTDASGNFAIATQLVTVTDNQKPVISCPANITSNVDLGVCGASVVISDPSATDNCTTNFIFNGVRSDGALLTDLYPPGTTTISWTTTDLAGNVSETCTQEVIVADDEIPVAVCKNITVTLNAAGNASIIADDINNGSSDNCGIQSVSVSKTSFNCSEIGLNNVTLTVYDASGNLSTCNSVVTVIDTNLPSISVGDIIHNENDGSVLFTVQLSNPRDCDVSFTAFTSDGSALAGGDYTSLSPTVYTIPAGSTSVAILIPIVDDTMKELTESFNLNLSNPTNCLLSDDQGVCTILDNDVAPSISIADAAGIEGSAIIFRLSLSNPTYEAITLTLGLTEGTASSQDFYTSNITITIPAETVNFNIPVATVQDVIDEYNEDFTLSIISVDSGTVGSFSDTGVGTIYDDDNFPVALDDDYTTEEDNPITLNVLLNDTFGGDSSYKGKITAGNGLHGTVVVNNGGTPNDPIDDRLVYTPDPDYFGSDSFTYTICDLTPDCSAATVNITVTSVNELPVANDDAILIQEDGRIEGESVAGNDILSGDGDNVWSLVGDNGGAFNGTVTMSADGTYNYISSPNFNGSDSFTYHICDKDGDCDQAVVTITVTSQNDKPTAVNDVFYNFEDIPILGETVAGNDIPSGDGGNVWSLVGTNGGALNGTVIMYPNGNFDYYPIANFNGTESFTYQICDVDGDCETARVTIILNAVGDAPYTEDDIFSTTEDTPIIGASVARNDIPSADGGNSWSLFGTYGGASHGKVVMNADGTFNYTPDVDFIGTDTFIYLLCDKENDCSGAQVTITVNPANDSPIARDDINITLMGMPASGNVLINDYDPDGDQLTIKTNPVTPPLHGTVTINSDGSYIYTPNPDYSGSDSFVYEVCDNVTPVLCSQAKVTISIIELINENNAPIAINDDYLGSVGLPVTGNVIANDIDPDGNLNMNSVDVISMDPQNGTFNMNPNGTFIFTPNAGFIGEVSFEYRICDLGKPALCDLATVTITILADPDKNSTFATDDSYFGKEDKPISGNVLSNDNDPQGDIQTVITTPLISPKHGALVLNSNGTFTYTPEPNFIGSDQFAYRLCDNGIPQACDQANVYLIVGPNNDSPMAEDDINTTFKDMPVSGNVLTNDSDPEGDLLIIKTNPVVPPLHGKVVINPDGTYLYTPNSGFSGTDSFVYEVCDNGIPVMCDQAKVTIKVIDLTSTNNPPVAINDAYQGTIGLTVSGNVISNDFDPDGNLNPTSVTLVGSVPANGELILNPDGTFTYIPEAGYWGRVSFDYRICDTGTPSLCDVATVTIDMQANPNGNSTFATDDSFFGKEDNSLTGNVLANDYDPQGDTQSVNTFVVIPPNHGSVTIDANGTFIYKPVPNYFGQDRFVYEVCDNGTPKACDQGTVYLIIAPQNDPPVAKDDIAITFKDKAVTGNILTNDSDPDGDLLIVKTTPVIAPANGTVVINPDGTYTYTSNSGFVGTDSFVYEVCDNATPAMCDQAKVTIKVIDWTTGKNNSPVAINDAFQGSIDLAVFGNVISNDFDLDGNLNMNSVKLIGSAPSSGSLTLNPDGTFTYIPVIGFLGQVTFDYQICDLGTPALCDVATVTIEILANPNGNSTFATDDSFAGFEDNLITGNVLANDNDPELNIQTVNRTAVIAPIHGSVVLNANGTFIYTPAPNYNGTDRFVYEVCDNGIPRACDLATVYLIILAGDDEPIAVDDATSTNEEVSVTGNVLSNDIPSNDGGNVWSIVDLPEQGELVFNPDGSYIYTPDTDFNGIDQFVYKLCDIDGDCSEATVSITVNPVNDLPEANDDAIVYHLEGIIDTTVVENDVLSGDGGNVWSVVTPPANGSIIFNPDGTFTYTAKPNFIGTDSFIYQLCDANGDCDQARVTIQIEDVIKPDQIFTPNGDGQNDTYHIAGIEYYPGSKLTIFNRWGNVVYQKIGYLNDWDGFSNVSKVGSTALPVGTYFYVLDYGVDKHKAGYVYLER